MEPEICSSGSLVGGKHGLQDCGDVYGDRLLCAVRVGMDYGLFHHAHRDLDLVRGGEHRLDHFKLLLQPVEGLHLRLNRSIGLQGDPVVAGAEL